MFARTGNVTDLLVAHCLRRKKAGQTQGAGKLKSPPPAKHLHSLLLALMTPAALLQKEVDLCKIYEGNVQHLLGKSKP